MGNSVPEKRSYIAGFAKQFGDANKVIKEDTGTDNKGAMLDNFLIPPWSPGLQWCAAFVTACAYYTDKNLGGIVNKYKSNSSQYDGAGIYSNNVEDARVGLAISWKNVGKDGGHVGIVVAVSSIGITVAEGNTNNNYIQEANGGETVVKSYTWSKAKAPSSSRKFRAYVKIWSEDDNTLGKSNQIANEDVASSSSSTSTTTEEEKNKAAEQELLNAFLAASTGINSNQSASDSTIKTGKETKKNTDSEAKQIIDNSVQKDNIVVKFSEKT